MFKFFFHLIDLIIVGLIGFLSSYYIFYKSKKDGIKKDQLIAYQKLIANRFEFYTLMSELRESEIRFLSSSRELKITEKSPDKDSIKDLKKENFYLRQKSDQLKLNVVNFFKDFHANLINIKQLYDDQNIKNLTDSLVKQQFTELLPNMEEFDCYRDIKCLKKHEEKLLKELKTNLDNILFTQFDELTKTINDYNKKTNFIIIII